MSSKGNVIDLSQMFDEFTAQGNNKSNIKEVYDIIPNFSQTQIHVISTLNYMIKKYELDELKQFIDTYEKLQSTNKNLGFFQGQLAKSMLKSYTNEELIRGIKPTVSHIEERA